MNIRSIISLVALICCCNISADSLRKSIDLSGEWNFRTDPDNEGIEKRFWTLDFPEKVTLPGTTDTNRKGKMNDNRSETSNLSRYYTYEGAAWYQKQVVVPSEWGGKHIVLLLERTRPSRIWIDGVEAGGNMSLSSPHRYELSKLLTPGNHVITVRVDNGEGIPAQIRSNSHACTESTQTNWNGIIGRIELIMMNKLHLSDVETFPDVSKGCVKVKIGLSGDSGLKGKSIKLSADAFNSNESHSVKPQIFKLRDGINRYEFDYPIGDALLWSDIEPNLYKLRVELEGIDQTEVKFGMREFARDGNHFTINGIKTFLRGKHDACVFPLTGHTPMGVDEWTRYFRICKEYGLNHCRFHSWCPPEACFEAADIVGIYLQPELPIWGGFSEEEKELMEFLKSDGENIMNEYSNHASFVMFALGNELWGEIDKMKEFVDHFRSLNKGHLMAYGSNIYLGWKGHIEGDDFMVTCRVGGGDGYSTHSRASFSFADADEGGYLNNSYPNTKTTFNEAVLKSPVPVIGHETGQFQIFPDFREIEKYKGVLAPWNFETFRERLKEAGMSGQAEDFMKASGAWSVELYRADIEMNLRSGNMAGFQLLDLQDYPGQGSAYVGILDAFMDSKGLIKPERWRNFCSEVVPLVAMEKYCWTGNERFAADIEIANYCGKNIEGKTLRWIISDNDKIVCNGEIPFNAGIGLSKSGSIDFNLPDVEKACKMKLSVSIGNTPYMNDYPLWVYPSSVAEVKGDVVMANEISDEIINVLNNGGSVLLTPASGKYGEVCVGGLFQTDYWNYRMFRTICENANKPVSPGTLGILTNPQHRALREFPTESHTNWQWYPIIKNSNPLILDNMPEGFTPIVQVIDNVERNHKLGLLFELRIGRGKLLVCMSDLDNAATTPEGKQLRASLLDYMNCDEFDPKVSISGEELKSLFTKSDSKRAIRALRNISYD